MKHLYLNTYLSGKLFLFLLLLFVSLPSYSTLTFYRWYYNGVSFFTSSEDVNSATAHIYIDGNLIYNNKKASTDSKISPGLFKVTFDEVGYINNAGKDLRIELYNKSNEIIGVISNKIPVIIRSSKKLSNITLPSNMEETDLCVTEGNTFTIDNTTIEHLAIRTLIIYPSAKVVVPEGSNNFWCNNVIMFIDLTTDSYPQLCIQSERWYEFNPSGTSTLYTGYPSFLNLRYILDNKNYYPFFPVSELQYENIIGSHHIYNNISYYNDEKAEYELQYYDQQKRMSGGSGWTVLEQSGDSRIYARKGYIIFAVPLEWNGVRQDKAVIKYSGARWYGPYTAVSVSGSTSSSCPPNDLNWNLIGNPFLCEICGDPINGNTNVVLGMWKDLNDNGLLTDGTVYDGEIKYVTLPQNGFQSYKQVKTSEAIIKPFNVFFVQTTGNGKITFNTQSRNFIPQHNKEEYKQEISLDLVLKQDTLSDNAGLLFGSRYTDEYDLNGDLQKMFGNMQGLSLYSVHNSLQHAFLALPSDTAQVTLGFSYADTGKPLTLTLDTLTNNLQWKSVWLTDLRENITVDLLLEDYTFTTSTPHDDHRFLLDPMAAEKAPSALEELLTSQRQQYTDGIYDMLGRRLDNAHLNQGVYIVVENGKPRKTVIR